MALVIVHYSGDCSYFTWYNLLFMPRKGQRRLPSNLPPGTIKTRSGHLRYTSPKELRGEYVHRHVFAQCLAETPYSIQLLVPWPYEVHHMNYNKQCNCPGNLLGICIELHSSLTADGRHRHPGGQFTPKYKSPYKWLPLLDDGKDDGKDDEVPF